MKTLHKNSYGAVKLFAYGARSGHQTNRIDLQGGIISQFPFVPPPELEFIPYELQDVMRNEAHTSQNHTAYQAATFPMTDPALTRGYVLYLTPKRMF